MTELHKQTIHGLSEICPAYQELRQFVTDKLAESSAIADTLRDGYDSAKRKANQVKKIQEINKTVLARMSAERETVKP